MNVAPPPPRPVREQPKPPKHRYYCGRCGWSFPHTVALLEHIAEAHKA
jgi:hypothetical protein